MSPIQRVTIRDVAREANVSIATVSKALNGVDVVRPVTKEKIIQAAEKLNYVPNILGKQLKAHKTGMMGFYTTSISGPYFSVLVDAIAKESEKCGYSLNVLVSSNKKVVMNNILGGMVDGIISFEDMIGPEDLEILKKEKIKAVFIDRNIETETIGSVVFDSYQASKTATENLLSLGHQDIAFLTGFEGTYDSDERLAGYKDALNEKNLPINQDFLIPGYFEEKASYEAVKAFFQSKPEQIPTAFVAGNDVSAIGAVNALKDLNYQIPADFSITSFDGIDLLNYFSPGITTIKNPIREQGAVAVNHLVDLINGKTQGKSFTLTGELLIRESVRKL